MFRKPSFQRLGLAVRRAKRNPSLWRWVWQPALLAGGTVVSALIAGNLPRDYLAAAAAMLACGEWTAFRSGPWRYRSGGAAFHVFDPRESEDRMFIPGLGALVARAVETGRPVWLRIQNPARSRLVCPELDVDFSRTVALLGAGIRRQRLKDGVIWSAEHPVPLPLSPGRAEILVIRPCGERRVRVGPSVSRTTPGRWFMAALALAATAACLTDCDWLLAATCGVLCGRLIQPSWPGRG